MEQEEPWTLRYSVKYYTYWKLKIKEINKKNLQNLSTFDRVCRLFFCEIEWSKKWVTKQRYSVTYLKQQKAHKVMGENTKIIQLLLINELIKSKVAN